MVARQRLRVGRSHAGKINLVAEDTHFRVLGGEQEIALHPRTSSRPITQFKAYAVPRSDSMPRR